jgi:tellurite resistance protein
VNIDVVSTLSFGDRQGLQDFFFVHRLVHLQIDEVLAQRGSGSQPNATLDSQAALDAWLAAMAAGADGEIDQNEQRALTDWLQLHANLHESEYLALKFGDAPDLSQADFRSPEQFYEWMYAHAALHDTLSAAIGLN